MCYTNDDEKAILMGFSSVAGFHFQLLESQIL